MKASLIESPEKGSIKISQLGLETLKENPKEIETKVVLIDGEELANLMIDHDIGVSKIVNYELKRIDSDYFIEE